MGFPQRRRQDVELSAQRVHVFARAPTQQEKREREECSKAWRRHRKLGEIGLNNPAENVILLFNTLQTLTCLLSVYSLVGKARHLDFSCLYDPHIWLNGFDTVYWQCKSLCRVVL